MSVIHVDARGFACPEPVLMTKKALEQEYDTIEVLVDNITAVQNINRFVIHNNKNIETIENNSEYILIIT